MKFCLIFSDCLFRVSSTAVAINAPRVKVFDLPQMGLYVKRRIQKLKLFNVLYSEKGLQLYLLKQVIHLLRKNLRDGQNVLQTLKI